MLAPTFVKILNSKDVLIERVLPVPGDLIVTKGTTILPYDHLGICTFSQKLLKLADKFRPRKFKKEGQFYYLNTTLGTENRKKIDAPFNGNLYKVEQGGYEFREEQKKYTLLSGVWGEVVDIVEKNSVLVKVQMKDINLVAATKNNFAGELVVFPNPTELLEKFYLENFASGTADGKIVYVGNHISLPFLKDAIRYGLGGLVGGSADRETYRYALESGISLGLFSGFGDLPTPDEIYEVLTRVSNRYIFFQGERSLLRLPMPPDDKDFAKNQIHFEPVVEVEKGTKVLVLQKPYFGKTGIVDSVTESSILVKFSLSAKSVEIFAPNFLVLNN